MRIIPEERKAIVEAIRERDREAKILLFGSRADDHARGGDIDILLVSEFISFNELSWIQSKIFSRIEEQKIDFVLTSPRMENAFARFVMKRGPIVEL